MTSSVTKLERSLISYFRLPVRIISAPYLRDMSFQNSGLRASSSSGCSGRGGASTSRTWRRVRLRSSLRSSPTTSLFKSTFGLSFRSTVRVTKMVSIPVMSTRSGTGSVTWICTVPAALAPHAVPRRSTGRRKSAGWRRIIVGRGSRFGRIFLLGLSGRARRLLPSTPPGENLLVVAAEEVIVLLNVTAARVQSQGLPVKRVGLLELARILIGYGQVVHQPGVLRIQFEGFLPSEQGLPPESALGRLHAEIHLLPDILDARHRRR